MIDRRRFLLATGALMVLPTAALAEGVTANAVFFDPDAPAIGNPKGDVTLVEFFDYQCPFCKRNHPVVEKLIARDAKLRVVMKDWPVFGPPSVYASQLVLGAQSSGKYKAAMAALMKTKGRLTREDVDRALSGGGVNPKQAEAGYKAARKRIDGLLARNDQQATLLGLAGTPGFVVGTTIYPGAMDEPALRAAIAKARKG